MRVQRCCLDSKPVLSVGRIRPADLVLGLVIDVGDESFTLFDHPSTFLNRGMAVHDGLL